MQDRVDAAKADVEARKKEAQSQGDGWKQKATDGYTSVKDGVQDRVAAAKADVEARQKRGQEAAQTQKKELEAKGEQVKEQASSWWSWGSGQAKDAKNDAADKVARGAESVKS